MKLFLDLTETNLKILDTLHKLQQKCLGWTTSPQKTAPDFTYEIAPQPLHRVMAHIHQ